MRGANSIPFTVERGSNENCLHFIAHRISTSQRSADEASDHEGMKLEWGPQSVRRMKRKVIKRNQKLISHSYII